MNKKPLRIVTLFLVCSAVLLSACTSPHNPIEEDEVKEIIIYDSKYDSSTYHTMSDDEISKFVEWFNDCTDIRLNSEFAGEVSIVGIIITLKDDKAISIVESGENFEVQFYDPAKGKTVSYWAKQKEIEGLLKAMDHSVD